MKVFCKIFLFLRLKLESGQDLQLWLVNLCTLKHSKVTEHLLYSMHYEFEMDKSNKI